MSKRLSKAQLDQRRAAAARPRGGSKWTALKVSVGVRDKIDRARGTISRNEYLDAVIPHQADSGKV